MATTTSFRSPPPMAHKRAKFSIDSLIETKSMNVECEDSCLLNLTKNGNTQQSTSPEITKHSPSTSRHHKIANRLSTKPHISQKSKMKSDDSRVEDEDSMEDDPEDEKPPLCPHIGNSTALSNLQCRLDNLDQWNDFHILGTEMIITKTGRRMFPVVKVAFSSVDRDSKYHVYMDIVPVDNKRLCLHPDSPFTSEQLVKQIISFEKVKLTNNELDKAGHQLILNSMHKYQPRVHVVKISTISRPINWLALTSTNELQPHEFRSFIYPETQFTAVTAYQNQLITKLKIDRNPFAKGFRDSSRLGDDFERYSEGPSFSEQAFGRFQQNSYMNYMNFAMQFRMRHAMLNARPPFPFPSLQFPLGALPFSLLSPPPPSFGQPQFGLNSFATTAASLSVEDAVKTDVDKISPVSTPPARSTEDVDSDE